MRWVCRFIQQQCRQWYKHAHAHANLTTIFSGISWPGRRADTGRDDGIDHRPGEWRSKSVWIFCQNGATTNRIFRRKDFSDTSVKILAFGAQNITKEPHTHSPAQLPSPSFSDRVHCVTNAAAYCLASILPLGFSNHFPPHLRCV